MSGSTAIGRMAGRHPFRTLFGAAGVAAVLVTAIILLVVWRASATNSSGTTLTNGTAHDVVTLTISDPVIGMTGVDVELTPRAGDSVCGSSQKVGVSAVLPTAGHAVPEYAAAPTATNSYHVTDLPLMMPGRWEITVDIDGGDCHDQLVFPLTISR